MRKVHQDEERQSVREAIRNALGTTVVFGVATVYMFSGGLEAMNNAQYFVALITASISAFSFLYVLTFFLRR